MRVSELEHDAIEALAKLRGLSISDFLRELALGSSVATDGRVARRLEREARERAE